MCDHWRSNEADQHKLAGLYKSSSLFYMRGMTLHSLATASSVVSDPWPKSIVHYLISNSCQACSWHAPSDQLSVQHGTAYMS